MDSCADPLRPRADAPPCGKSAALRWFGARVRGAIVPPSLTATVAQWRDEPAAVLAACARAFGTARLAVRSDAAVEDRGDGAQAGRYRTCLDVAPDALHAALDAVAAALPGDPGDAVLVQPMVQPVAFAAVAATHRIDDGAPWYCIELAAGDSAIVTAGRASGRQIAIARSAVRDGACDAARLPAPAACVLALLAEIEALCPAAPLEIEAVLTENAQGGFDAHLLQVRPIARTVRWRTRSAAVPALAALAAPDRDARIVGARTLWSLMSDWNPAELLGVHPRPLALSLFRRLIGDGVWWRARASLGYRPAPDPRVALLAIAGGRPYVDVRRSANSLLPAGLPLALQTRIVDACIDRLAAAPELHDKFEFAIHRTARDFTAAADVRAAWRPALDADDVAAWDAALTAVTIGAMQRDGIAAVHRRGLDALQSEDGAHWTAALAHARRGTFGFAALARIAFIAEAQLRSAIARGALAPERAQALRASAAAVQRLRTARLSAHGPTAHLRPGTFEITHPTWAEHRHVAALRDIDAEPFVLQPAERRMLDALLAEARLPHAADAWTAFVAAAVQAREWAKLVFSRHLSHALDGIAAAACAARLDRETASWLTLAQLQRGARLPVAARRRAWRDAAERAAARHAADAAIVLGPVLCREADRDVADSLGVLPNFVGRAAVDAPVVVLDAHARAAAELRGAIVAIRHADPGYDWLFDCGVAGLITAWGGANSHMAIRCAEFGLSAAIGCGEAVFARVADARHARIDPLGGALWVR